jgi:hypothetical protein
MLAMTRSRPPQRRQVSMRPVAMRAPGCRSARVLCIEIGEDLKDL